MNLGDGFFTFYWVLLLLSGALMLTLGGSGIGRASKASRILNLIFGVAFVCYGLYLGFFFNGGTYIIFLKVFIVPVLMVVNVIRGWKARPVARPGAWQPIGQIPMRPMPNQQGPVQQMPGQQGSGQQVPPQWPYPGGAPQGQWQFPAGAPQGQWQYPAGVPQGQMPPQPTGMPQGQWQPNSPVSTPENQQMSAPTPVARPVGQPLAQPVGQPTLRSDDVLGR